MSTTPKVTFPARSGHYGTDVFNSVVAIFCNRMGCDFNTGYNKVGASNGDLKSDSYSNLTTASHLDRLFNRIEKQTGLSGLRPIQLAADGVGLLTNRFFPALASLPTSRQWDICWRAALMLEKEGAPERLMKNRSATRTGSGSSKTTATPTNEKGLSPIDWEAARVLAVSAAEWKDASSRAGDVFNALDEELALKEIAWADFSKSVEGYSPDKLWYVFRSAVEIIMNEQKLPLRQAFDQLKERQPLFWARCMLSCDPKP
jgi:hypothetical protein